MASADQLVEDQAERKNIRLHAGAAGDELLRRHVCDGASTRGVGGLKRGGGCGGRAGGIEVRLVWIELAGQAKVENLDEAAVGEHDVGRLQVAMEDAELVRGGEAVGDLDAGGEHKLQAGRPLGDYLVQRLAGDVLHDDVGFGLFLLAAGATAGLRGSLAYIVDRCDVRVIDGRGQTGLAELRGAHLLQRQRAALEQLDDDGPLQAACRWPDRRRPTRPRRSCAESRNARLCGASWLPLLQVMGGARLRSGFIHSIFGPL